MTTVKWSSGRPSEPWKRKCLPVSCSSWCSTREPWPVNCALTRGFIWTRNASTERGAREASSRSLRSTSIAIVSSESTTPSPSQVGQGRVMISRTPSVTFWRVISTRPSFEISAVNVFVRSSSSDLRRVFRTASRFLARAMSMKSMTMMPPMSRSRSWLTTSSAASRFVRVIVSSSRACLPRPTNEPGVHVDDRQRLGVVDHEVAAAGQVDPARDQALHHVLDPVAPRRAARTSW